MKRIPTASEVRSFLAANAGKREDGRWDVPSLGGSSHPMFEPAALKIAEMCMLLGVPLSDVITSDLALVMARRIVQLEDTVARCSGTQPPEAALVAAMDHSGQQVAP